MLNHRSSFVVTRHRIKQRALKKKLAKNGILSTVEEKPTLYSLFHPSIYFLIILVVIVLGGLLCIVRII